MEKEWVLLLKAKFTETTDENELLFFLLSVGRKLLVTTLQKLIERQSEKD